MTLLDKLKTGVFWVNTLKIAIPFFIVLVIISILFNSFSSVMSFDIDAINIRNFSEGKWKRFFFTKSVVSLVYGIWMTARNMR